MERYEFKYGNAKLAVILPLSIMHIMMQDRVWMIWRSMWRIIDRTDLYDPASTVLLIIIFAGGMWFGLNRKGYAILHKNHVEIKMGWGKVREIKYSQIKGVFHMFTPGWRWVVDVSDGRNINAYISMSTKHNKVLEEFMKELKKRAKV